MNPAAGMGLVMGALAALMLGTRWLAARAGWSAEASRKTVHVGMGLICLSFPWLFRSASPVIALGVLGHVAWCGVLRRRRSPAISRPVGSDV